MDENIIIESLRPNKLKEYIGQENIKKSLSVFIEAATKRNDSLDHVLIHGCPGLGKTTLANIIAHELGSSIRVTSGPAITRIGDLASILTNLEQNDCLFIDEIHRLPKNIEEALYPVMEDFSLDLTIGKGPSAKNLRLDIPRFTLIGATTRIGAISSPMRDRFGVNYQLNFYADSEIEKIIKRSAKILKIEISDEAVKEIAKRSRKTPRIANRLLARIRDFAQVKGNGKIDYNIAQTTLGHLDIDKNGLDQADRKIITVIGEKFNGGPVGLSTIAAATNEERETLEGVIEPYLLQLGLIVRTPQGRKITPKANEYLNIKFRNTLL
ncbi:MAG: Holliday junction DNA helicase subunit RuvB [Candidatus Berkelbacteria bacterium Licking1014_85]|uniref:Holliday junction branch migration complex subunit RuvB n=1 Tax=Candidatus Berkelbacteria bacterium Licking1014_85 TaxID=2017148 RepID=A0A554LGX3_9BACT|nr:MAG: Holliday junction DNA helicase subunit RuvB [Candidatus Berkelbacteria bacterium Licking1014_85]